MARSMPKLRARLPITRSIGLPSCVPLVKYTPRTHGGCAKREPVNTCSSRSESSGPTEPNCAGKPKIAARRVPSVSRCMRAMRPSLTRLCSKANSR
ncbi:hypothetical protein D9M68_448250 [compost metagenome]